MDDDCQVIRSVEVKGNEFIMDPELFAIMAVLKSVEPLNFGAKNRVISYVTNRLKEIENGADNG